MAPRLIQLLVPVLAAACIAAGCSSKARRLTGAEGPRKDRGPSDSPAVHAGSVKQENQSPGSADESAGSEWEQRFVQEMAKMGFRPTKNVDGLMTFANGRIDMPNAGLCSAPVMRDVIRVTFAWIPGDDGKLELWPVGDRIKLAGSAFQTVEPLADDHQVINQMKELVARFMAKLEAEKAGGCDAALATRDGVDTSVPSSQSR